MILRFQSQASKIYSRYQNSKLLKSGVWYLLATFGQRGLAFVGVFIFTRLMSVEEYGEVSIFFSWVAIFASTITLNVHGAISPAKYDKGITNFPGFVSALTMLGMFACLVAIAILWLAPGVWIEQIFGLQRLFLLLAAVVVLAELWVNVALAVWQIEYRYKAYAIVSTGLAAVKLLLPIMLITLTFTFPGDNALARIVGTLIGSVIFGLPLLRYILAKGKTWLQRDYWRYALVYGIPLIPHALSGFILSHFDRILIDRYVGRSQAGLYTFAYQIGEITAMLWYASNSAWVPWFFEQMGAQRYGLIRQRSNQYLLLFAAISVLVILLGPLIVVLLAPPEYQVARKIVPVIMCSQFFNVGYSLYANVEFFEKKTGYISIGTALAAGLNVVLNVILLPIWGYPAAAWSTLVSYILLFVFHAWIVKYRLKSPATFNLRLIALLSVVMVLFTTVIYFVA